MNGSPFFLLVAYSLVSVVWSSPYYRPNSSPFTNTEDELESKVSSLGMITSKLGASIHCPISQLHEPFHFELFTIPGDEFTRACPARGL